MVKMSQNQYNWVYKKLVTGPNDVVGALAYVLYKQQKIAYLERLKTTENREPTDAELNHFHMISSLPDTLEGYQERAETLADEFLEIALSSKLREAEAEIRQSVTIAEIKDSKKLLTSTIETSTKVLEGKVELVQAELNNKKGAGGWFRDVGTNFVVNLLTVIVVGFAAVGVGAMDTITSLLKSGITQADQKKSTSASEPTSANR